MNNISSISISAKRLNGKVAIITGGASGFGEATARLFVYNGAKVVIADVQDEKGLSICKEITSSHTNHNHNHLPDDQEGEVISYVHCNVTLEADVENLIQFVISKHGKLDIMYNNVGILGDVNPTILSSTLDNFRHVFETNVCSGFLGAKHAAKVMIPRRTGVILFTASVTSVIGGDLTHAYTMSKHGLLGLMKSLCVEMGEYGIRVNGISPYGVSTPFVFDKIGMDKSTFDQLLEESNVLKGVVQDPVDVANAALYLASDEARFVSGLNLMVDGGHTITNTCFATAMKKYQSSCLT